MKARFDKMNYRLCEWSISGKTLNELGVDGLDVFTPAIPCSNSPTCREETVGNATYVVTYLTITNPMNYLVNASILCISSSRIVSWYGIPKSK